MYMEIYILFFEHQLSIRSIRSKTSIHTCNNIIVKSYGGLAIIPPSFNDWEHPKQVRTKGGQHCKRLRTNVPTGRFTAVGNGTCWDYIGKLHVFAMV
jgi:hypothetical protein